MRNVFFMFFFFVSCAHFGDKKNKHDVAYDQTKVFQSPVSYVDTTYDEFSPSVDLNRNTVVYVARVSNNTDIFLRKKHNEAPVRLTTHSTDDIDPVFSRNGKWIAWSSQAEDVKGDIWLMDHNGDNKKKLTDKKRAETSPSWSFDGKYVYYTSKGYDFKDIAVYRMRLEDGQEESVVSNAWDPVLHPRKNILFYVALNEFLQAKIWVYDLNTQQKYVLNNEEGFEAWPKAVSCDGKDTVFFVRYTEDTNKDNEYNIQDKASVWKIDFDTEKNEKERKAIPVTSSEMPSFFADTSCESIFYTASSGSDLDIYTLPFNGFINPLKSDAFIYESAFRETRKDVKKNAFLYLVNKKSDWMFQSLYQLAKDHYENNDYDRSLFYLNRIVQECEDEDLLNISKLEYDRIKILSFYEKKTEEDVYVYLEEARKIAEKENISHGANFRYKSILALKDFLEGRFLEGLKKYQDIAYDEDSPEEDAVRAFYALSEHAFFMEDIEFLSKSVEHIVKRFQDEKTYTPKIVDKWILLVKKMEPAQALSYLNEIALKYKDIPFLSAKAVFEQGVVSESFKDKAVSFSLWQNVAINYSSEKELLAESLLKMSHYFYAKKEYDQALVLYEKILVEFPERADLKKHAKKYITLIAIEEGRLFEQEKKWEDAKKLYERLIKTNPENAEARRHYVYVLWKMGVLEEWIKKERKQYSLFKYDKYRLYGLAYGMTFSSQKKWKKVYSILEEVLTLDPRFAVAHLTMGYVRNRLEFVQKGNGWLEKAISSYDTANGLADPVFETYIVAASLLNKAHALFELGKSDDAFLTYMARENMGSPFENDTQKMVFKESFSRAAMHEEHYDVALHMAKEAASIAERQGSYERMAYAYSILGACYYLVGQYEQAHLFYKKALFQYEKKNNNIKSIVMMRGVAMSLKKMRRFEESIEYYKKIISLTENIKEHREKNKAFLLTYIPVDPLNSTRALYGFSLYQEKEIAYGETASILEEMGQSHKAYLWQKDKVDFSEHQANMFSENVSVQKEYVYALNKEALFLFENKMLEKAYQQWDKAFKKSLDFKFYEEAAYILENIARIFMLDEKNVDQNFCLYLKNKEKTVKETDRLKEILENVSYMCSRFQWEKSGIKNYALYDPVLEKEALFTSKQEEMSLKKAVELFLKKEKAFNKYEYGPFFLSAFDFLIKEKSDALLFELFQKMAEEKTRLSLKEFQEKIKEKAFFIQKISTHKVFDVWMLVGSGIVHFYKEKNKGVCQDIPQDMGSFLKSDENKGYVVYLNDGGCVCDVFLKKNNYVRVFSVKDVLERHAEETFFLHDKVVVLEEKNTGKMLPLKAEKNTVLVWIPSNTDNVEQKQRTARYFLDIGYPSVFVSDRNISSEIKQVLGENTFFDLKRKQNLLINLYGFEGLSRDENVKYASKALLLKAKECAIFYKKALSSKKGVDWEETFSCLDLFAQVLSYLKEEKNTVILKNSTDVSMSRLPSMLEKLDIENKTRMAFVFVQLKKYEQGILLQKEVVSYYESKKDVRGLVSALSNEARFQYESGFYEKSLHGFLSCAKKSREISDNSFYTECLMRAASCYQKLFDHEKALQTYKEVLEVYKKESSQSAMQVFRHIGSLYETSMNDTVSALAVYEESYKYVVENGWMEYRYRNDLDIARIYRKMGLYSKALASLEKVFSEEAKEQEKAEGFLEKAKILWYMARYESSLDALKNAEKVAEKTGDTFLEIQCYSLKGLIFSNQGLFKEAETALTDALYLSRATTRVSEEASQLNNLGVLYRENGFYEKAMDCFEDALKIDLNMENIEGQSYDLKNRAVLNIARKRYEESLQDIEKAIVYAEKIGNVYNNAQSYYVKGELLWNMEKYQESYVWYEKAWIYAKKYHMPEIEWRSLFGMGLFEHQKQRYEEAFRWYVQALDVVDGLGQLRKEAYSGKTRQDVYNAMVSLAYDTRNTEMFLEFSEREKNISWRDVFLSDEAVSEKVYKKPSFMAGKVTLKEIQNGLPLGGMAVSYYVSNEDVFSLWISKEAVVWEKLLGKSVSIKDTVDSLKKKWGAFASVEDERRFLSEHLLVKEALKKVNFLYIVPHGVLFYVPYAALYVDDVALIEKVQTSYAFSLLGLKNALYAPKGKNHTRVVSFAPDRSLFFSQLEARSVSGLNVLLGDEVRNVRWESHVADAWDIAAHTLIDSGSPLKSGIVLNEEGKERNIWRVKDVLNMSYVPHMVSLSVCDGVLNESDVVPWLSLSSSFLLAGSKTVLAAQSRVSDLASAVFMKRFYRYLGERKNVSEAFQEASLWVKKQWSHPAHWAGFMVFGEVD